ncbi:MAG: EamA family transporter [Proteobacteria bacterium]|nr:EamA family transporter [Pseudomonadota bacterium]
MPLTHLLLTLLVVIVWGANFLFVGLGLQEISPLLLCATRFLLASVPAIFFIKPPKAPFKLVALYGLVMFALQFSLLFVGMYVGMTPGMASLIMQVQVFFSMFFAAIFLGEKPSSWQIYGALISFMGIAIVAFHFDADVSLLGFLFILAAAATWGVGNLITKKIKKVNMISLVVWGSFVACFPMFILSMLIEGFDNISHTYNHISWVGIGSLIYIVYGSTWIGYGIWNWLVSKYPVSMVVPFTLLVPIVGMLSSILVLGEPMQSWKVLAAIFVIVGLCLGLLGPKIFARKLLEAEIKPMA